ncbi:DUF2834 domain-containing protein [cf. Phormidesmis sp. LEGE 11477]|uniref:DUF2834 domain-containing protein n=1 Tax=cf. Phormidesmis sp. LEGE 11477 TaxID=1828680 RepID=UPI001880B037|nr:DUF2834 domain-containing protein [cf. Phormidesmis sp. LEGE 11477]MBE9063107.1 DUF2834 domain-containing protein [cf. Phormidesmis sp. LEGE 11477]
MTRKIFFAALWLGFSLYAFTLAPPQQPDTFDLIVRLSSGQWAEINPAIVALFNLMGVWPLIYACLALIDGTSQKITAWPFVVVSFAVGAFAILPYLALRQPDSTFHSPKTFLLKLVDSVWTGRAIALASLLLLTYGVISGNWSDFARQWQTSQFIHVMSLDFCMLCAIVSPLLKDDMARRNLSNPTLFWIATLIPLLGIAFYLSVRPPLESIENTEQRSSAAT